MRILCMCVYVNIYKCINTRLFYFFNLYEGKLEHLKIIEYFM